MGFTVETGFAVPEKASRRGKPCKYPFDQLTVTVVKDGELVNDGGSFFVPNSDFPKGGDAVITLKNTAKNAEDRLSTKDQAVRFSVYPATKLEDGIEISGARIWRTE